MYQIKEIQKNNMHPNVGLLGRHIIRLFCTHICGKMRCNLRTSTFFSTLFFFRPYLFFNWNYALISLHFKEGSRQKGVDDYVSSSRPQASSRLLKMFTLVRFQVYFDLKLAELKKLWNFSKVWSKKLSKRLPKYFSKIVKKNHQNWYS